MKLRRIVINIICLALVSCCLAAAASRDDDDVVRTLEKQRREITEKEEALKQEESRLIALRKDVEGKIEKYTAVLARIEEALKRLETAKDDRLDKIVKVYEAMPAEDAAARLSAMDQPTATMILFRMKFKKAGAIMASMEPGKAAAITELISKNAKKIPTK